MSSATEDDAVQVPLRLESEEENCNENTMTDIQFLNPRYVQLNYESGDDVVLQGDIDSMTVICCTMEPFKCTSLCKIRTKPVPISVCKNVKITAYLKKRREFRLTRQPRFRCLGEQINKNSLWYEFAFANVDDRQLFALFQTDFSSPFFKDVPIRSTFGEEGRLRAIANAFVRHVIACSARKLSKNSRTAKTGIAYIDYDVDRVYSVIQEDYGEFTAFVTETLKNVDLRLICGISCLRFYMCQHGLRLDKNIARICLRLWCRVNHAHIDVIQIHRADELGISVREEDEDNEWNNNVLLVKLMGRDENSLLSTFTGAVNIVGKTEKYRRGFLSNYGYFHRHASPPVADNIVTYVQAYSSAAKMARPQNFGLLACYYICRGFRSSMDRELVQIRSQTRQYTKDLISYCRNYVRQRHRLRIEEVLTFDYRRLPANIDMLRYIQRYRVFDVEANAIMTDEMLARRLIYRFENWREYFDKSIKRELNLLTVVIRDDLYFSERTQWTSSSAVRRVIRAEFRIMYFVHGRSTAYNYEIVRHMMTNDTEGKSIVDKIVQLRPLDDDSDDFLYPLYSADIPVRMIRAIRTVWCVINALPDDDTDDEESDDEDTRALRFVIAAYGTWAYTNAFLTDEAALCSDVLDLARRCYQRYERVFTLAHFLQEYRRYAKPNVQFAIRGIVQADYVARTLILNPRHMYNRIIRTSVQVYNATTFFERATAFIKRSVHVVPSILVYPKRKDITWLTVKVGDFVTLSSGVQVEPRYIRQRLHEIDRNRRSRAARDDDRSPRPPRRRRREPIRSPQPEYSDSSAIDTPSRCHQVFV